MRLRFASVTERDHLADEAGRAPAPLAAGAGARPLRAERRPAARAGAARAAIRFPAEHARDYLSAEWLSSRLAGGARLTSLLPGSLIPAHQATVLAGGLVPAADSIVGDLHRRMGVFPLVLAAEVAAAGSVSAATVRSLARAALERHADADLPVAGSWRQACLAALAPHYGPLLIPIVLGQRDDNAKGWDQIRAWLDRSRWLMLVAAAWPEEVTALLLAGTSALVTSTLAEGIAAGAACHPRRSLACLLLLVAHDRIRPWQLAKAVAAMSLPPSSAPEWQEPPRAVPLGVPAGERGDGRSPDRDGAGAAGAPVAAPPATLESLAGVLLAYLPSEENELARRVAHAMARIGMHEPDALSDEAVVALADHSLASIRELRGDRSSSGQIAAASLELLRALATVQPTYADVQALDALLVEDVERRITHEELDAARRQFGDGQPGARAAFAFGLMFRREDKEAQIAAVRARTEAALTDAQAFQRWLWSMVHEWLAAEFQGSRRSEDEAMPRPRLGVCVHESGALPERIELEGWRFRGTALDGIVERAAAGDADEQNEALEGLSVLARRYPLQALPILVRHLELGGWDYQERALRLLPPLAADEPEDGALIEGWLRAGRLIEAIEYVDNRKYSFGEEKVREAMDALGQASPLEQALTHLAERHPEDCIRVLREGVAADDGRARRLQDHPSPWVRQAVIDGAAILGVRFLAEALDVLAELESDRDSRVRRWARSTQERLIRYHGEAVGQGLLTGRLAVLPFAGRIGWSLLAGTVPLDVVLLLARLTYVQVRIAVAAAWMPPLRFLPERLHRPVVAVLVWPRYLLAYAVLGVLRFVVLLPVASVILSLMAISAISRLLSRIRARRPWRQ